MYVYTNEHNYFFLTRNHCLEKTIKNKYKIVKTYNYSKAL